MPPKWRCSLSNGTKNLAPLPALTQNMDVHSTHSSRTICDYFPKPLVNQKNGR